MAYYGGFAPYVSVAKRKENAKKKMDKLRKKGMEIQPIEIEGRKIAKTFWGEAWCDHMESFSDYANRLPRGRTYARNGSVCHLDIKKNTVKAIVSGSSLYNVEINIKSLVQTKWQALKKSCSGKISSLLEFLAGRLSDGVMAIVCGKEAGLFPAPNEMTFKCDCPDWANMCKHVAAVLYGVGARLDCSPEKLFELRAVNHAEMVDSTAAINDLTTAKGSGRRRIIDTDVGDVFGIELEAEVKAKPKAKQKTTVSKSMKTKTKKIKKISALPKRISGNSLKKKRLSLRLTQARMAKKIGVSAATVSQWERQATAKLVLKEGYLKMLGKIW